MGGEPTLLPGLIPPSSSTRHCQYENLGYRNCFRNRIHFLFQVRLFLLTCGESWRKFLTKFHTDYGTSHNWKKIANKILKNLWRFHKNGPRLSIGDDPCTKPTTTTFTRTYKHASMDCDVDLVSPINTDSFEWIQCYIMLGREFVFLSESVRIVINWFSMQI